MRNVEDLLTDIELKCLFLFLDILFHYEVTETGTATSPSSTSSSPAAHRLPDQRTTSVPPSSAITESTSYLSLQYITQPNVFTAYFRGYTLNLISTDYYIFLRL